MKFAWLPALLLTCVASAQEGPLETRIHRAIDLPFLRIDPRGDVLGKGTQSLSVSLTSANDLRSMSSQAGALFEDYEVERFLVRYRKGLGNGFDYTIDLPVVDRGGGFMDPFIEFWHQHVLGIHGNIRDNIPYGQSQVNLPDGSRYSSAFGIGDLSGAITKQVSSGLQVTTAVKVPTGNAGALIGSGAFDAALSLEDRFHLTSRWDLYVQLGEVFQGKATSLANSRPWVHQESLSLVKHANRWDDWIIQWESEASAIVTGIAGSDSSQRSLSLAYRRKWKDHSIEAFFTEDGDWLNFRVPELVNIAPDFTIGVHYNLFF